MSKSRILVAVSSPWASERLAVPIVDLARRLEASVIVAHVTQLQEQDEKESDASNRGQETLRLLTEGLVRAGLEAEGVLLFSDDISKALINTAKARNCTLIVVGLSGKGVIKRLIAGDVPANLTRQSDLPVLLLPANWSGVI